jgi:hypothetical protein
MDARISAAVEPLLQEADRVLRDGYSAVLYGSAARGDYHERTSDINLLLLLPDAAPATLRALGPAFKAWREKVAVPPLIMTREEWSQAADVFPLELTDIRAAYRMLRGPDPVAGPPVDRAALRHALESELRGKLLRLRQGFALLDGEPRLLGALATHTLPTLLVLYRALLELHRRPVVPPSDSERVIREVAMLVVAPPEGSLSVVRHRAEPEWSCTPEQFQQYLSMVERAARHVDHFQSGDRE